ncbi:hypothetical protein EV424DRAFT_1546147 [Suillus variegatus]|nr:hypothetical protein EV424DRAFT_1546147 [Suillus variegatus]
MSNVTVADTALNVFGNVAFIDIQNAISVNNTYFFSLNVDSPSLKTIVFRIGSQQPATISESNTSNNSAGADDSETESEPEDEGNSDSGDDMEMQTEDVEDGTNITMVEDEDLAVIGPEFQPVIASLCDLLTRRAGNPNPDPKNPTAPWSYYVKKKAEEPDLDDDKEEDGSIASA